MGMSSHVTAFRDQDGKFKEMLEAKLFCDQKKLSYPKEVSDYFGTYARESVECIKGEMLTVETKGFVKEWHNDHSEGFEVEVKDIPEGVKTLRFANSW
jgi:hypothetical protein